MQKVVVLLFALALVIPIGAFGVSSLFGPQEPEETATTPTTDPNDPRPTVDPESQPTPEAIERPELPPEVSEQTAEGAQAAVEYLLGSYTYMMTTGDTSVWDEVVDPNCEVCTTFMANAEQLNEQGGYLVDGEFAVESTSFEPSGDPPATGTVTAQFTQESSILIDDPTREGWPLDAVSGELQASMTWDGERWRVADMSLTPDDAASPSDGGGTVPGGGEGG